MMRWRWWWWWTSNTLLEPFYWLNVPGEPALPDVLPGTVLGSPSQTFLKSMLITHLFHVTCATTAYEVMTLKEINVYFIIIIIYHYYYHFTVLRRTRLTVAYVVTGCVHFGTWQLWSNAVFSNFLQLEGYCSVGTMFICSEVLAVVSVVRNRLVKGKQRMCRCA